MRERFIVAAVMLLMLSAPGCVSLRYHNRMNHSVIFPETLPETCLRACERLGLRPTHYVFVVQISTQTAALYADGKYDSQYRCSTSRYGIGQTEGSNCTPLGLHQIAEKIGAGEPPGTVFQSRQVVGHTSDPRFAEAKITTRIMWLDGLEPGFNRGGTVDSHGRYIYIHGTGDQSTIGQPASSGCTLLADPDLLKLFDLLPSGTMVWIER